VFVGHSMPLGLPLASAAWAAELTYSAIMMVVTRFLFPSKSEYQSKMADNMSDSRTRISQTFLVCCKNHPKYPNSGHCLPLVLGLCLFRVLEQVHKLGNQSDHVSVLGY